MQEPKSFRPCFWKRNLNKLGITVYFTSVLVGGGGWGVVPRWCLDRCLISGNKSKLSNGFPSAMSAFHTVQNSISAHYFESIV